MYHIGIDNDANRAGPVGTIIMYAGTNAPRGYFTCDGRELSRTAYAALYAAIGTTWDDVQVQSARATTFKIPDLRDRFLRMSGPKAGEVGSKNDQSIQEHTHTAGMDPAGGHGHDAEAKSSTHSHNVFTEFEDTNHEHAITIPTVTIFATVPIPLGTQTGVIYTENGGFKETPLEVSTAVTDAHRHELNIENGGGHKHEVVINKVTNHQHAITVNSFGSLETKPTCATVLYCIKF